MSREPTTSREALVAELVGDQRLVIERIDGLLDHMDRTEVSYQATAANMNQAGMAYRAGVDDMLARVRAEFASLLTKITDHAASTVLTQ